GGVGGGVGVIAGVEGNRREQGGGSRTDRVRPRWSSMAYDSLAAFLEELEAEGELVRVKAEVDPILEIAEITDRISKAHGPALLFENVRGSRFPLTINVLGSERRMAKALGVND